MYENIIAIHNVLKKNTTQLNFQPAQYLKKISKDNFEKKNKKRRRRSQFWVKKKEKKHVKKKETKAKKKTCYSNKLTRFRVLINNRVEISFKFSELFLLISPFCT